MFTIIAAIGKNNELGKKNGLCFRIKDDMNFFRETTLGHKVVMGLKTWNSLPGKLKERENIVVSKQDFRGPDSVICDLDKFISKNKGTNEEIFIIGGGIIYAQFLPFVDRIYLTEIDAEDEDADTFFPNFNKTKFKRTLIKKGAENGLNYTICRYDKLKRTDLVPLKEEK